jgi:aminoglycoside 6'-N-acetyltransferase I
VRHVEAGDAEQWAALRGELWPEQDRAELAREVDRFFANPRRGVGAMPEAVFVAETDRGRIVGFAEVSRRLYAEGCETSPVAFLEGWYVMPEARRDGVGGALIAAAEGWARDAGCREFASDALADNALSATAHRALGFEEVEVLRCFRKGLGPERPATPTAGRPDPCGRPRLSLELFSEALAVCRLDASSPIPSWVEASRAFLTVSRTSTEVSITALESVVPVNVTCHRGYRAFRVRGSLSLDLVGILASIADPLAAAGVSIFAISTHETDYVLVRTQDLDIAANALRQAGHEVHL